MAQLAANDGLIELDQTIDHYLDQEILSQLPDALRPTIRQLLNHTSGIPDYYGVRFYLTDWQDRGPLTLDLVLRAIRGKKATHRPGEAFSYSNTNYHLVAAILEKVHATDLATLLKRQLFVPLALNDTYYNERSPRGLLQPPSEEPVREQPRTGLQPHERHGIKMVEEVIKVQSEKMRPFY